MTPSPATPLSDLDCLQEELAWVEARCRRIGAEKRHATALAQAEGGSGTEPREDEEPKSPEQWAREIEGLRFREVQVRHRADEMIAAAGRCGLEPSLVRLQSLYGLDDEERNTVLLTAAPCFSLEFHKHFGLMSGETKNRGFLTVDAVFSFLELSAADRIRRRGIFSPSSRLVSQDLIKLDVIWGVYDPEELLSSNLKITPSTFRFLVGEEGIAEDLREFSALVARGESQTASRPDLFRHLCVAQPRHTRGIPPVRRLDLTKNLSTSLAEHFLHGLLEEPRARFERVVLPDRDRRRILSVAERRDEFLAYRGERGLEEAIPYGRGALLLLHGPPGTGKTMTAHALAHRLGKKVLTVHGPQGILRRGDEVSLPAVFREARLHNALLFFDECEETFSGWQSGKELLTHMERFDGVAVLATNQPKDLDEAFLRRILVKVRFTPPDREARLAIWQGHLPEDARLAPEVDLEALASRYELTGGTIKNAVLAAAADAFHAEGPEAPITMEHLERAAAEQAEGGIEELGELSRPGVRLQDLVLPADLTGKVEELIDAARDRRTVLDRWKLGARQARGKGVSALFSGDPGTGKTLCAEAVAAELDLPLLVVSLPEVVSMWVGETEKNIDKLFRQARASRAVLFLDECDALLLERGGQRDSRHDLSSVNVLLQRIERHEGVCLLATNFSGALDRALDRRLAYHLRFPFPDEGLRARIWQAHLEGDAPLEGNIDFTRLGGRFPLAGGHIKNAVYKAAFRAARAGGAITQRLLEEAAREECDACGGVEVGGGIGFQP